MHSDVYSAVELNNITQHSDHDITFSFIIRD